MQFVYNQIMHVTPKSWKDTLVGWSEHSIDLDVHELHLIRENQIYCLKRLNSKEIKNILIESNDSKLSLQIYYDKLFQNPILNCVRLYMLPLLIKKVSRPQIYKLLNNVLSLNKMLFRVGKINSSLFFFCKMGDEIPFLLFYDFKKTRY